MKKKNLHIIAQSSYAGVTTYTIRIVKNLPEYEHHIISCYKGNAYKEILEDNIACENLINWKNISYKSLLLKYYKVISFFLKDRYDIIHYHQGGIGVLLLAVIFGKKAQIIHHLHGGNLIGHPWRQDISYIHLLLLKFLSIYTYQIAVADHVFNEYKSKVKSIENLRLIRNGVPYIFQKKESRKNSIGYIGRSELIKGYLVFKEGSLKIKSYYPGIHFIMMGDNLKNEATHIEQIPSSFQTIRFYQKIDLILFTSDATEGLPLVVLEALAFDVGVVARPLKGVVEILGEDYPLYFKNNEELISKVEYFYSDNFNRDSLSNLHQKRIKEFNFDEMIQKINLLYKS